MTQTELKKLRQNNAVVVSSYELSTDEMGHLESTFPELTERNVINVVDTEVMSGVILYIGTKRIDLSLKGQLQNLKQFMYEKS
jgi:F0F1-type ATP synthase delta subunit